MAGRNEREGAGDVETRRRGDNERGGLPWAARAREGGESAGEIGEHHE